MGGERSGVGRGVMNILICHCLSLLITDTQARECSAVPMRGRVPGDERAESPTVGRPQTDERDPGADGPHECAEGLAAEAPTSMA